MKNQSNLSKLMAYAGKHRVLTYLSWVLSVISALVALVPFWYIWSIIRDVLAVAPHFAQAENIAHYGWAAVLFAVISIVVYIGALICSHLSAFRVASNIRKALMQHIVSLPLGVTEKYGSGSLRRIVNTSSAATENYLAHRLPDKAGAIATPAGLLVLLLAFDWRLGLLSLIPVGLGFLIMMKMTGAGMEQKMREYQNSLSAMSNEAVEYVRGVPVVKTFGQTIFSFKRFKAAMGHCLYKSIAPANDVLYNGHQRRICLFNCRGHSFCKGRRNQCAAAEFDFLYYHYACYRHNAYQNHVHERRRHDCRRCIEPN